MGIIKVIIYLTSLLFSIQQTIDYVFRYAKYFGNKYVNWVLVGSLFLHPGLIIVDHIHFQYNGLLYGILILSIVEAKRVSHERKKKTLLKLMHFFFFAEQFTGIWYTFRCVTKLQTHLSVHGTSLFCLFTAGILFHPN